jgi:very-short-patch-repair endonuclease
MPRQLADFLTAFQKTVEGVRHPNISEQRIGMYLKRYPGVTFLTKPFIDGFETDHMIKVGRTIVNVEVDGSFHNDPEKRIADGKRDEHLRKKMATVNFKILRVPSTCSQEELFTR